MSTNAPAPGSISHIQVRLQVGHDRMAGTDDPLFLRLHGPAGREFRLAGADGYTIKRDDEHVYVLGAPDHPETNVAHPELNDPTIPALAISEVLGVSLVKGMEPIPNVRGIGELDDRVEIESVEVEIHCGPDEAIHRYSRQGPIWLGLASGFTVELAKR